MELGGDSRWFSVSPTVDQTPKIDETKSLMEEWKWIMHILGSRHEHQKLHHHQEPSHNMMPARSFAKLYSGNKQWMDWRIKSADMVQVRSSRDGSIHQSHHSPAVMLCNPSEHRCCKWGSSDIVFTWMIWSIQIVKCHSDIPLSCSINHLLAVTKIRTQTSKAPAIITALEPSQHSIQ